MTINLYTHNLLEKKKSWAVTPLAVNKVNVNAHQELSIISKIKINATKNHELYVPYDQIIRVGFRGHVWRVIMMFERGIFFVPFLIINIYNCSKLRNEVISGFSILSLKKNDVGRLDLHCL